MPHAGASTLIDVEPPTQGQLARRGFLGALAGIVLSPANGATDGSVLAHAQRFMFGSPIDVMVSSCRPGLARSAVEVALAGLQRMNDRWNAWKPGDVHALNAAFRAGRSHPTTPALRALVRGAAQLELASSGLFNAGMGGAVSLWGFHDDVMRPGRRPDDRAIAVWTRARPSLAQVEIRGTQMRSSNPHLQLDFGAYAKGVAIDWALDRLRERGFPHALVNLGGNLAASGQSAGRPWQIGIRDPSGPGLIARVAVREREAVVTSGSYERYRVLDGERYTHILDPASAMPAPEFVSVTVLHPRAAFADAAATALLVAGPKRWRRVAQRMGITHVLIVDRHLRVEVTAPLAQRLQFADSAWRANATVV